MFDHVADRKKLEILAENMKLRNFEAVVAKNKQEALSFLRESIPSGAEVMTASSTTLKEIGFVDYLSSSESKLISLQNKINQENDESKRQDLRRKSVTADYFVSSVNAVTEDGVLVAVDATGSRTGAMPFAAKKLILVVGAQKITKDLDEAMRRIREYVFPLENERAMKAYGAGSMFGKWVILEREAMPGRIKVILVEEALGF